MHRVGTTLHVAHLASHAAHTGVVRTLVEYRPAAQDEQFMLVGPEHVSHVPSQGSHTTAADGSLSYFPATQLHAVPLNEAPGTHAVHDVADPSHSAQLTLQGSHNTPCPGSLSNWPGGHTQRVPVSTEGGGQAVHVVGAVLQAAHWSAQLLHTIDDGLGSLSYLPTAHVRHWVGAGPVQVPHSSLHAEHTTAAPASES